MIEKLFTIGVYGRTESEFFAKIEAAHIDTFCDIRQRRAVRGAEYAFVNSNRLQAALAARGIAYLHVLALAPTTEMREAQYKVDEKAGISKRARQVLGDVFKQKYSKQILGKFDSKAFSASLPPSSRHMVLFCAEAAPAACHRSLVAERLEKDWKVSVEHL